MTFGPCHMALESFPRSQLRDRSEDAYTLSRDGLMEDLEVQIIKLSVWIEWSLSVINYWLRINFNLFSLSSINIINWAFWSVHVVWHISLLGRRDLLEVFLSLRISSIDVVNWRSFPVIVSVTSLVAHVFFNLFAKSLFIKNIFQDNN